MNPKYYYKAVIIGMTSLLLAVPTTISAHSFQSGLQELSTARSYKKILDEKINTETKGLQESLKQIDVVNKIVTLPSRRLFQISERDFQILSRIVEAEATDKDMKSKILVANVVLNRLASKEFPNSIEGVVFQREHGAVQFSPTADGRYYSVNVTQSSKESVERALTGEDYSQGAMYFVERSIADPDNVNWFDRALTRLFEYEGHAFYK